MIDLDKCVPDGSFMSERLGFTDYFFNYPMYFPDGLFPKTKEQYESEFGKIVSMCIMVTEIKNKGRITRMIAMSPTAETAEDTFSDIDWVDLRYGVDYEAGYIEQLIEKSNNGKKGKKNEE